jgi:dipeptidyl aminopeptidase/acylaminoacyl peptidase
MTTAQRLERDLPQILDELAISPYPDYIDDVLAITARRRQRPAWTLPERLPFMTTFTPRAVAVPRAPLRLLAVAAILLIALAVGAALLVGSRPRTAPPFGVAGAGLVAYASGGDIYTVDPDTGTSVAIVKGPENDSNPRWSRDGTQLAFERTIGAGGNQTALYVTRADGTGLGRVTPRPLGSISDYSFSPDGRELLISAVAGRPQVFVAATDGTGIRELVPGIAATNAAWRPPDGAEILFMGAGNDSDGYGSMYLVDRDGGHWRTISDAATGCCRGHPFWSPDGSKVAYVDWDSAPVLTARTHVMAADGSSDRVLPLPSGASWQGVAGWSNDGNRLLVVRGRTGGYHESVPALIPADGSGPGTEIAFPGGVIGACCAVWEWAPDDSSILGTPVGASGAFEEQILLDPETSTYRSVPWRTTSQPAWQRTAP